MGICGDIVGIAHGDMWGYSQGIAHGDMWGYSQGIAHGDIVWG